MSFFETVARAKAFLREHQRVSVAGLMREFELDEVSVEPLIEELVDVQGVAVRTGLSLTWSDQVSPDPVAIDSSGSTPTPDAERRQMSVVFCDLVDSTRLADGMDPEDFREIVVSYYDAATAVVQRFGGHVAQYLGDGLLVYFGYPQAHEDDAERAVRAALAIVESIDGVNHELEARGTVLSLRIGISTGTVVLGDAGDAERGQTVALGDTMNLAARLQGEAEPNSVVISEATLGLVQGIFVTRDLGSRELKGVAGPTAVHEVVRSSGMRSRIDVAAATGLTPLIGRDEELGLLEARFAQVEEEMGQAVFIGGEPGIGKSRLLQAFGERMAKRAHTWLECRASPLTQSSVLYPVIEAQPQMVGFAPSDSQDMKIRRFEARLAELDFDLAATMPLVAQLHDFRLGDGYPDPAVTPEAVRKQTLEFLCDWLIRLSHDQPLVLVIEDLHWLDASTLELLGLVMTSLPAERMMLIGTHRPEFDLPWARHSNVTPMQVLRLTRSQLADLVRSVSHGRGGTGDWVDTVVERADGVPLFAEELTLSALSLGAGQAGVAIPATLKDSLTARLDRLGPVKELVQLCAVLGREFGQDLLGAVSHLSTTELQEALAAAVNEEIFYQHGSSADATFLFKHALLRDAAYDSMVRTTTRRYHRRTADAIVALLPAIATAQPELVAYHFEAAGALEEAMLYYQRAGESAQARSAHFEAVEHLTRALEVFVRLPSSQTRQKEEFSLQMLLGVSLQITETWTSQRTHDTYRRAIELGRAIGDPDELAFTLYSLGMAQLQVPDPAGVAATIAEFDGIKDEMGADAHVLHELLEGGQAFQRGGFEEALSIHQGLVAHFDPTRSSFNIDRLGHHANGAPFIWTIWELWITGRVDESGHRCAETVEIERAAGSVHSLGYAFLFPGMREVWCGNTDAALAAFSEMLSHCEEHVIPGFAALAKAWQAIAMESDPVALMEADAHLEILRSANYLWLLVLTLPVLADAKLRAGLPEAALSNLSDVKSIVERTGAVSFDAEIRRIEADARLAIDPSADATPLLHEAIDIARAQDAKSLELRAATSLARMHSSRGETQAALRALAPIHAWFTSGFDTRDLITATTLLSELQ